MDSLKYNKIKEELCQVRETLLYMAFLLFKKFQYKCSEYAFSTQDDGLCKRLRM